jgi:hypothetical protein
MVVRWNFVVANDQYHGNILGTWGSASRAMIQARCLSTKYQTFVLWHLHKERLQGGCTGRGTLSSSTNKLLFHSNTGFRNQNDVSIIHMHLSNVNPIVNATHPNSGLGDEELLAVIQPSRTAVEYILISGIRSRVSVLPKGSESSISGYELSVAFRNQYAGIGIIY